MTDCKIKIKIDIDIDIDDVAITFCETALGLRAGKRFAFGVPRKITP